MGALVTRAGVGEVVVQKLTKVLLWYNQGRRPQLWNRTGCPLEHLEIQMIKLQFFNIK